MRSHSNVSHAFSVFNVENVSLNNGLRTLISVMSVFLIGITMDSVSIASAVTSKMSFTAASVTIGGTNIAI